MLYLEQCLEHRYSYHYLSVPSLHAGCPTTAQWLQQQLQTMTSSASNPEKESMSLRQASNETSSLGSQQLWETLSQLTPTRAQTSILWIGVRYNTGQI